MFPCIYFQIQIQKGNCQTHVFTDNLLLGCASWDDEAQPDHEQNRQEDSGNCEPSWDVHTVMDARKDIRPAPKEVQNYKLCL